MLSEEEAFLVLAEQQLVSRCMRVAGFEYVAVRPRPSAVVAQGSGHFYEERSLVARRQDGYGLSKTASAAVEEIPVEARANNEIVAKLTPAEKERYTLTLFGSDRTAISVTLPSGKSIATNSDGCLSEARRALYLDLERWLLLDYIGSASRLEINAAVRKDERFLTALRKWADCMKGRGFSVHDPGDAKEEAAKAYEAAGNEANARSRELEIAVADGECGEQSSFYTVLAEVEQEHTAAVNAKNEANVIAFREMQAQARDRAKRLLARSGSGK
ncbi:MAG TPA: hypothetical protein VNQ77_01590 [Frankiaceae bacterium]|nr:hypothetical protein [Frankiaceae bacterium]